MINMFNKFDIFSKFSLSTEIYGKHNKSLYL
jgi:hypothetical protein